MAHLPPSLIFFLAAGLACFFKGRTRTAIAVIASGFGFFVVHNLETGTFHALSVFQGFGNLELLRVDKLSRAFGYIFTLNAFAAFLYALAVKERRDQVPALVYIGGALGSVFAGDIITLYVHWELMAVASTLIIFARKTDRAKGAAFRYLIVHLLGGLLFLAGMAITVTQSGSIGFENFEERHLGTWLILAGFLVNAAAPPLSAWLSDAYPEAGIFGGLILSAYTTKTAVYALLRGFAGWEILIVVGCIMTVYGIVFALLENDMRRILAYSIINQVGFMVCAAGIGTSIAMNGAVAHAFCHIIYKSLLWMSAGAVLYRVGKSKCTELGGLYRTMPWTMVFGTIGALAISAVPLTSGFTSKTLIIQGAAEAHLFWPWLILEIASAGVFLHAGIKFPYFVFFAKDRKLEAKEAPLPMLLGMAILAFLCLYLGIHYQPLHAILPFEVNYEFHPFTGEHVTTQMQLLAFSALPFFLFLAWLKRTDTIVLDTDFFYRKTFPWIARGFDRSLNGINAWTHKRIAKGLVERLSHFFQHAPARIAVAAATPYWKIRGYPEDEIEDRRREFYERTRLGAYPVGITACIAVVMLGLLYLL